MSLGFTTAVYSEFTDSPKLAIVLFMVLPDFNELRTDEPPVRPHYYALQVRALNPGQWEPTHDSRIVSEMEPLPLGITYEQATTHMYEMQRALNIGASAYRDDTDKEITKLRLENEALRGRAYAAESTVAELTRDDSMDEFNRQFDQ